VRDHHERALVVLQGLGQRFAHFDVEVIGGLVEEQEDWAFCRTRSAKRQPRLLAAGKAAHGMADHIAADSRIRPRKSRNSCSRARGIELRENATAAIRRRAVARPDAGAK
jgi:hypothetical protein